MDRVARRGPLARAPGALKVGHFRNCQHFCRSWRGDPLEKKQIFGKKSHHAGKLKRGTLWGFSTSILSQNIKKLKGENFYFWKKISQCRNKLKGGTLWGFPTSILTRNSKKIEGGPFGEKNRKNCLAEPKKIERGTLWSRPVWYVTRKNRKTFLVQFAWPNGAIWCNNIL